MLQEAIKNVVNNNHLSNDVAIKTAREIMSGKANQSEIAAFLIAMRMKGETAEEIASFVQVMRECCHRITPNIKETIVDACGTGGDNLHTFNISTIASFVAAAANIPIAKHGNRSISSKCGSADILEALGVNMKIHPDQVSLIIEKVGIGFMFAPLFHPAMKYVQPVRKALGIRTMFNMLGPMTNPAFAQAQVIGIYDPKLSNKIARALQSLGLKHVLVVHGGGMDEISSLGPTNVVEITEKDIKEYVLQPSEFGITKPRLKEIQSYDMNTSIRYFKEVLKGKQNACLDIVLLNAAAVIYVGGKVSSIKEGYDLAFNIVQSGKALDKFEQFREETNKYET
jgi:anthranilate phosphoribosyltransferase